MAINELDQPIKRESGHRQPSHESEHAESPVFSLTPYRDDKRRSPRILTGVRIFLARNSCEYAGYETLRDKSRLFSALLNADQPFRFFLIHRRIRSSKQAIGLMSMIREPRNPDAQ